MNVTTEDKFTFSCKGQGEPLILLHGLFGDLSNFGPLMSKFSDYFQVYTLQLPLYTLPILSSNIKSLAEYLKDFINYKKFTKVHLLGNSLGGHVGLVYAVKDIQKIKSLVLTGSSGLYENAFGGSFPRREDKSFLRERIQKTFYDPNMVTDELVDNCFEVVNNKEKLIRILHYAKSAIRHNMRKQLSLIQTPACLIWGKNDTITPPEVAVEFEEKLPDSELFWIDKCGHAPMMEHADVFNQMLYKWYLSRGFLEG